MSYLFYYLSLAMIILVPITGIILLLDKFLWRKKRHANKKSPWFVLLSDFLFPIVFIVSGLRCFIVEPFTVPTGSMQPTIYGGDMILANKWSFGLRYPIINTRIFSKPGEGVNRGDIAVFKYPEDTRISYIKRIVGLPGDVIDYKVVRKGNSFIKQLTVNGQTFAIENITSASEPETDLIAEETMFQVNNQMLTHKIQYMPQITPWDRGLGIESFPRTVPEGMYFAMGDNRDNSLDSRKWGFVPDNYLIAKANFVWMNYNCIAKQKHCGRIFTTLK